MPRPSAPSAAAGLAAMAIIAGALLLLTAGTRVEVMGNTVVNPTGPGSLPESLIAENNSPSLARNPVHADNLVVSNRLDRFRQTYSAALHWSDDGGAFWQHTDLPLPAGRDRPFAPDIAFAPDGTLYVIYVNLHGIGNDPENLWLSRSVDGGRTLSAPSRIAGGLTFQARLVVDHRGRLLVTWLQGVQVGTLSITGPASPIVMARSTDGGRTFSEPIRVSDGDRRRVGAASAVVEADGDIDVLYEDFKGDVRDFGALEGPAWDQPFSLVFTRSTDGGRTFASGNEVDSGLAPSERFLVYLPVFPSLAAGADGSLYTAWADARNGDDDVFLRRSLDHGGSWSAPVRVNDNPMRDGTRQWMPSLAVAPDGRVDVAYLDGRSDPHNRYTEAYLATSDNGGASFTSARLSTSAFDTRVGSSAATWLPTDLGSRMGIVSDESGVDVVWTDTRLGTVDTGRQDIVEARARITGHGRPGAVPLLAAGAVLAAAAAVLRARRI